MVAISMLESNFSGEEGNWCPLEGAKLLHALQAAPTRSSCIHNLFFAPWSFS